MDIKKMTSEEIMTLMQECSTELNERDRKKEEQLMNKLYDAIHDILDEEYEINLIIDGEEIIIFDDTAVQIELN